MESIPGLKLAYVAAANSPDNKISWDITKKILIPRIIKSYDFL